MSPQRHLADPGADKLENGLAASVVSYRRSYSCNSPVSFGVVLTSSPPGGATHGKRGKPAPLTSVSSPRVREVIAASCTQPDESFTLRCTHGPDRRCYILELTPTGALSLSISFFLVFKISAFPFENIRGCRGYTRCCAKASAGQIRSVAPNDEHECIRHVLRAIAQ